MGAGGVWLRARQRGLEWRSLSMCRSANMRPCRSGQVRFEEVERVVILDCCIQSISDVCVFD